jgi:hypothetical protein
MELGLAKGWLRSLREVKDLRQGVNKGWLPAHFRDQDAWAE